MHLKIVLIALTGLSLLIFGFRPDELPYLRYDALYSDAALAHWPNAVFFRESIITRGEFPVWRETTMAGQPFAANPLNKTAYPLQWLVLLFPPSLHLNLLILLHLVVAGSGMWYWVRLLGLRPEAAAISTLAYVLAPRLIGHLGTGHLDVVYALAWWPWLMWASRRLISGTGSRLAHTVQCALLAALLVLADSRVTLFAFGSAAVYILIELNREKQWKQIVWYVLAGVLVLILTASLTIPLALWQPYLSRISLSQSDSGVLALQSAHFLGLVLPAHRPSVETLTYLGLPVLALAAIGISTFPRRLCIAWIAVILFVALYAMGANAPVWSLLVRFIPPLLWFRVPSRAWLILALLIPLLAGYGTHWLLTRSGQEHRYRSLEFLIVIGTAVAVAFGIFALFILKLPPTIGFSALVGGLLIGGALLLILNQRVPVQRIPHLLIVLVFLDLVWTGYQWVDWRGQGFWLDPGRSLAERLVAADADRIYSPTYSLEQQVAEVFQLRLFGGVDPFQLVGVVGAVEAGSGVSVTKYDPVLPPLNGAERDEDIPSANKNAVIDTQILADWRVSHVVAAYPLANVGLEPLDTVNGVYIYTNRDYSPSQHFQTIPDWPAGWPDLPDQAAVARMNQTTVTAAATSAVAFFISLALLIFIRLRERRV